MLTIQPQELRRRLDDGDHNEILVDVREVGEYKERHIAEAKNIPLTRVHEAVEQLKGVGTVYLHCESGGRSARACQLLEEAGVHVVNLDGGLSAWEKAGLDVVRRSGGRMSLVRQVMLTAGMLVVFSVGLGVYLHPYWYGLAVFVGLGLAFSGLSGKCLMMHILARMPWNR